MGPGSTASASFKEIIKALGLVFGDIGTSPIYTLVIIFTLTPPTPEHVFGILSLIVWTLIVLVTVGYWWLAMSLSHKGEGGVIVLKEILVSYIRKGRKITVAAFLGYIGISLLMGDGVITPAISILSAVEGIPLIPGFSGMSEVWVIGITIAITILLFTVQSRGTDTVASSFGPIMVLWFAALLITGLVQVVNHPSALAALSPWYALKFLSENGWTGFLVLSEVILCATGGEALYADMGHLGAKPIRQAWVFVFFALVCNYLGQGVFALQNPGAKLFLFSMVKSESELLYVPFLILTILATIIASQAMISAVFSLVYQGITTRTFPLMKIKYTSHRLKSQIYIGAVNWSLLAAVIFMVLLFKQSSNLAAAYGLAVTITMTVSSVFMIWIFRIRRAWLKVAVASLVLLVEVMFLVSLFSKIPHGGYWSIIIAAVPFGTTLLWVKGQERIHKSLRSMPMDVFLLSYEQIYNTNRTIPGTALFFARGLHDIPPYVAHCIISSNIIYEKNILVSIDRTDYPYDVTSEYVPDLAVGLSGLVIKAGYQEILDLQQILKKHEITEKVIFYGVEDIITTNFFLRLYATLKKLSPNFVQFYKLPYKKIHGVVTRIQI